MGKRGKSLLIVGVIFVFLSLIFSFFVLANPNNYKIYDSETRTISVFSPSDEIIANIILNTPLVNYVGRGEDRLVAKFTIENYENNYNNVFKQLDFYDKNNGNKKFERDFVYKYKIKLGESSYPIHKQVCNPYIELNESINQNCSQEITGYEVVEQFDWIELEDVKKNELPEGEITIGIFIDVYEGDYVEWIPTLFDVEIIEWASWNENLTVGLVAYWNHDTGSGTNVVDRVRGIHNGTTNADWLEGILLGNGTDYNGINERTTISDSPDWNVSAFTIVTWIKPNGCPETGGGKGEDEIVARLTDGGPYFTLAEECESHINYADFGIYSGGWSNVISNFVLPTTWVMVTGMWNGSNMTMYINDTLQNNSATKSIAIFDSDDPIELGGAAGAPTGYFDGIIDETGFWNRTLSQSEITQLYNDGKGRTYPFIPEDTTPPNITIISPLPINYSIHSIDFNLSAIDDTAVDSCWYTLNGGIYNYTLDNDTISNFYDRNTSITDGSYTAEFYCNDIYNNINDSEQVAFTIITDIIAPTWKDNLTDASDLTKKGDIVHFNITLEDNKEGGYYIFSFDNGTESFVNDTPPVSWTTPQEIEITRTITANKNQEVRWKWYFSDAVGNNNKTPIWSFTIANTPPTHDSPLLKTPTEKNLSTENLICYNQSTYDADGDEVTNIYNWFKDSQSILSLNLPFEINANDYSGNNNHGTNYGATSVSGKYGKALNFDGDDYIEISDSNSLDFGDEKTWQLWFKRVGTGAETLFDKGNTTNTNYKLSFLDNDRLKFSYSIVPGEYENLWETKTESDFNEGNYTTNTEYSGGAVMLSSGQTFGNYTSKIFDAQVSAEWNNISWTSSEFGELPDNQQGDLMNGNVLLMHMNNNWNDASGNNYTGTGNGGVGFTSSSKLGSHAGSFDGSNDYVDFGNILGFERTNTFSGGVWIKTSDTSAGILSKLSNTSPFRGWHFQLNAVGKPALVLSNTWGTNMLSVTADVVVNDNSWHHVLFTYDGSSNNVGVKIYVDGVSKDLTGDPSTLSASILNSKDFQISGYDGTNSLFGGLIDEAVIWNRNLTAEEVLDVYQRNIQEFDVEVRSCDDGACSGEGWTDIEDTSPQDLSVGDNRYFQYKFGFETDDSDYSPKLYNVSVGYLAQVVGDEANITSSSMLNDTTKWYLATITLDGATKNLSMYIDDSLDKSEIETSSPIANDEDLIIGNGFNGSIDEVKIYNHALSQEQITNNFNLNYNTIVSEETSGGDNYLCQVTPNDAEADGVTLNSSSLEVLWVIEFDVRDSYSDESIDDIIINCNYSEFSQEGDAINPYGPYGFPDGSWECNFSHPEDLYFDKIITFTADNDKTVNILMSESGYLTIEEHTWLEAIYNCISGGDCALYNLLLEVNNTVGNIWEHTAPTDEDVVVSEIITNKVVDSSHNLTIDYSVYIPIKAGYNLGAYLPVRIGYWFLDSNNESCYSQGEKPVGVSEPYCQPLIIETLGPMGGTVNFTVELQPALVSGSDYSIKRIIDIDPNNVWINYGQETIGTFLVTETLTESGVSLETTGESMPNSETESSLDRGSSSGGGDSVTNVYNTYVTEKIKDKETEELRTEQGDREEEGDNSWITGGVIGTLLDGKNFIIILGIFAGLFVVFIIYQTIIKLKKR